MTGLLSVGELARTAGVSAAAIRYYERMRVLPPARRSAAGYRLFPAQAVHRLRVIREAQQFGFSLAEIAGFLTVRDAGGVPCRDVRAGAQRILERIDAQIADLRSARRRMQRTLAEWDRALASTPAGSHARLLERLTSTRKTPRSRENAAG